MFSTSDEYETALITERRAQGRYQRQSRWPLAIFIGCSLTMAGAVLLRAMVPLKEPPKANLAGKPILILSGQFDPIIPSSNSGCLAAMLVDDGARVRQNTLPVGHGLTQADVDLARRWIHEQGSSLTDRSTSISQRG